MKLTNLIEEIKYPKGGGIIIFDIDDTLVSAVGVNIYKQKDGKDIKKLTPEEFAKEDVKKEQEKGFTYDYRDFNDENKLYNSIVKGSPIINNLRMLDAHLRAGWDIGFLTARSGESANKRAILDWLKFRDKDGELKPIPQERIKYFIAVNDPKRQRELKQKAMAGDFDAKGVFLKEIKSKYKNIKFVDDDAKNLVVSRSAIGKKGTIQAHKKREKK